MLICGWSAPSLLLQEPHLQCSNSTLPRASSASVVNHCLSPETMPVVRGPDVSWVWEQDATHPAWWLMQQQGLVALQGCPNSGRVDLDNGMMQAAAKALCAAHMRRSAPHLATRGAAPSPGGPSRPGPVLAENVVPCSKSRKRLFPSFHYLSLDLPLCLLFAI